MIAAPALAHAGGVDEAAMIGLPIVLFALFFWLERRARRRDQADGSADGQGDGPGHEVRPDRDV